MSMDTANSAALIRSELWSRELKDVLMDELMATKYVNWMQEFPDGTTFTIPSVGNAQVRDYAENEPVIYDPLDTGEFQFTISEYIQSGMYITKKARQDAFYSAMLEASFVPKQRRAIMEHVESTIFALQSQQTASDLNNINSAAHRWVANGTSQAIAVSDFAYALYSLKKANVPQRNLVAIVDPSVEYTINTITNITNVSNNPMWEGLISSGVASGMRFVKNIYGFDVYTSNYLAGNLTETVDGASVTSDGVANLFFSASSDIMPFIGAWRQEPQVDGEYNKDRQREEYITTARYGVKLYRPENLCVVLSSAGAATT